MSGEWPRLARPLLERWDASTVYTAGLEALGYPPTWISEFGELKTVFETLNLQE